MGTAIELDVPVNLYDQDLYVWTMEQADLLRLGRLPPISSA